MKIYALAGWSHTRFFLPWRAGGSVLHSCPCEAEPALTNNDCTDDSPMPVFGKTE